MSVNIYQNGTLTPIAGKTVPAPPIKQDGVTGSTVNRFGTCSTAAGTAAKTVSITAGTFSLEAGARVSVKFNNANTASTPTLNVNSTGAKNIFHKGSQITTGANKALLAGTVDFIYDGTQWHLVGNYTEAPTLIWNKTTDTDYNSNFSLNIDVSQYRQLMICVGYSSLPLVCDVYDISILSSYYTQADGYFNCLTSCHRQGNYVGEINITTKNSTKKISRIICSVNNATVRFEIYGIK